MEGRERENHNGGRGDEMRNEMREERKEKRNGKND